MGNNLPVKKDSIVEKIKKWFKGIFAKKENTTSQIIENDTKANDAIDTQESFVNSMKSESENNSSYTNSEYTLNKKRDDEIEKILKNPEVLYDLPMDKLEMLKNIVKEQEKKYEQKLAQLKK